MSIRCTQHILETLKTLARYKIPKNREVIELQTEILNYNHEDFNDYDIITMNSIFLKSKKLSPEMKIFLQDYKVNVFNNSINEHGEINQGKILIIFNHRVKT